MVNIKDGISTQGMQWTTVAITGNDVSLMKRFYRRDWPTELMGLSFTFSTRLLKR